MPPNQNFLFVDPDSFHAFISLSPAFSLGYSLVLFSIILCLIFISAMISGAESAFFSLGTKEKSNILKSNTEKSRYILLLLENPNRLLATIHIANNFVNLCVVILSTVLIQRTIVFHSEVVDILFNVVIITFLILLFGEIIPKILAGYKSLSYVRFVARFIGFISKILSPFSFLLVKAATVVENKVIDNEQSFSMDDLSTAVSLSTMSSKEDKNILTRLVKFRETTVREIMVQRIDVTTIESTTNFQDLKEKIIEWEYSRVPVYQNDIDKIIGVLHLKDILPHIDKVDYHWLTLLRKPLYVPENKKINDLLEEFKAKKIHFAIVVDEYGGFSGIVTLEDVLEEVVGEINDESDAEQSNYIAKPDGSYIFEGKTTIHELCQVFTLPPHYFDDIRGTAETISGLLLERKGDFVKTDEELIIRDFRFYVAKMEGHRILKIQVFPKPQNKKPSL